MITSRLSSSSFCKRLTGSFEITVLAPHSAGSKRREVMDEINVERFRYAPERLERLAYDGGIPANGAPLSLAAAGNAVFPDDPARCRLSSGATAASLRRPCPLGDPRRAGRIACSAPLSDAFSLGGHCPRCRHLWLAASDPAQVEALDRYKLRPGNRRKPCPGAANPAAWRLNPERVTVQAMGTDLQTLFVPLGAKPASPTLVYAGRLVAKKGVDVLLRATALLLPRVPGLRIVVAGHGPEQQALQTLCDQLGISAAVRLTGPYRLQDLPQIYAQASVAVFPFRTAAGGDQDGLGLAVIEAMGCGVPVVGTALPALKDFVQDGFTGLLAPPENPTALAQCIQLTLLQPAASAVRAKHARQFVLAHYDWEGVAARYAGLLGGELYSPCRSAQPCR